MITWIKKIELENKNFKEKDICLLEHQYKIREVFKQKFDSIKGYPDVIVNYNLRYMYGYDNYELLNTYRDCVKYKNHILFLNIGFDFIGVDYINLKDVFLNYNDLNSNYFFYILINNQMYNPQFDCNPLLPKDRNYCSIEKSINDNYQITYKYKNELVDIKKDIDYEQILENLLNPFDYIID